MSWNVSTCCTFQLYVVTMSVAESDRITFTVLVNTSDEYVLTLNNKINWNIQTGCIVLQPATEKSLISRV